MKSDLLNLYIDKVDDKYNKDSVVGA
jgi:hypothetical protein